MSVVSSTSLPTSNLLRFLSRGKVRDLYAVRGDLGDEEYLLFVATDRISAYDVIMENGIPGKGRLLTAISSFWFSKLSHIVKNHLIAASIDEMPPLVRQVVEPFREVLEGRTMLVKKAQVVKLEAIVRGYLTGSAWSEYKRSCTVHGIPLPDGLEESCKLSHPLFTPSTKADQGEHDENLSPERAKELIGSALYESIEKVALALYTEAHTYALSCGLILADTKFEFGLVPRTNAFPQDTHSSSLDEHGQELVLIDEALTPDSSRYWSAAEYLPGRSQRSYDKQFLRDWLVSNGFKKGLENGPEGHQGEGWKMSEEVVEGTRQRYEEAVNLLTGR